MSTFVSDNFPTEHVSRTYTETNLEKHVHFKFTPGLFGLYIVKQNLLDVLVFVAMAFCSFASVTGGNCGPSNENPCSVDFVNLEGCNRDITAHLKSCRLAKNKYIDSEMKLMLARAGQSLKILVI